MSARSLVIAASLAALACRTQSTTSTTTAPTAGEAFIVHNAVRGDMTLVEDAAGEPRTRALPCAALGKWALSAGVRDQKLVALDTEHRQLAVVDLGRARASHCAAGEDLVVQRTPLHGKAIPYRGAFAGDRLYVSFFSENRLEVYRWPSLDWERDIRFDAPENLGLGGMATDGRTLFVTATGYVCFERDCPAGRFHDAHLFFVDPASQGPPRDVHTANVNTLFALASPPFLVSAGDIQGGYGSLQAIHADQTLGAEIRLPSGAGPSAAHAIGGDALIVNQMSGEHVFMIDTKTERLAATLRFDGNAFTAVAPDVRALPERSSADFQDVVVDAADSSRVFLVDAKGDRLVRARRHPGEWTLAVERVSSLATESFHTNPTWMVGVP